MGAQMIITELQSSGFKIRIEGDLLKIHPASSLTNELRQKLRAYKPEILEALKAEQYQVVDEAIEERLAIMEESNVPDAEEIATLARDFYNHLFGEAKWTGCCYAPKNRYCAEGRRLKDIYYEACQ